MYMTRMDRIAWCYVGWCYALRPIMPTRYRELVYKARDVRRECGTGLAMSCYRSMKSIAASATRSTNGWRG